METGVFLKSGKIHLVFLQKLPVSAEEHACRGDGTDPLSRDLSQVPGRFHGKGLVSGSRQDADADRMGGGGLTGSGQGQKFFLFMEPEGDTVCTTKFPLVMVPVLSMTTTFTFFKASRAIPPLKSDPLSGSGSDAGEEGQGTLKTRAQGTADDKEGQGCVDPVVPVSCKEGREDGGDGSQGYYHRGVDPGEFCDEPFLPGASGRRHFPQNPGSW